MIQHFMAQGSAEWAAIRLGIPTSSNFDRIITPSRGEMSKSARGYAFQLAAELVLRQPPEPLDHVQWVERGRLLEPDAVRAYAFASDLGPEDITTVGFITNDSATAGCSPDRLLAGNGGLEVKCPAPQTHIGYVIDGLSDGYRCQLQGQLLLAELSWVDFFSWHPEMPPYRVRIGRDDTFIAKLETALAQFEDLRQSVIAELGKKGFFDARPATLPVMGDFFDVSSGEPTSTAQAR